MARERAGPFTDFARSRLSSRADPVERKRFEKTLAPSGPLPQRVGDAILEGHVPCSSAMSAPRPSVFCRRKILEGFEPAGPSSVAQLALVVGGCRCGAGGRGRMESAGVVVDGEGAALFLMCEYAAVEVRRHGGRFSSPSRCHPVGEERSDDFRRGERTARLHEAQGTPVGAESFSPSIGQRLPAAPSGLLGPVAAGARGRPRYGRRFGRLPGAEDFPERHRTWRPLRFVELSRMFPVVIPAGQSSQRHFGQGGSRPVKKSFLASPQTPSKMSTGPHTSPPAPKGGPRDRLFARKSTVGGGFRIGQLPAPENRRKTHDYVDNESLPASPGV